MATEVKDSTMGSDKMDTQQEEKAPVTDESTKTEDLKSALSMLSQGKRNMICGEIPVAVNQFQEACSLLAKHYGETAKECAEAYFCYGQSLLDLARMETGVLGNALQGVDVEEENEEKSTSTEQFEKPDLPVDEREKLRMEVVDAMSEKQQEKENGKREETCENEQKSKETAETEKSEDASASKEGKEETNGDAEGEAAEEEEGGDDDEAEEAGEEEAGEDDGEGPSESKEEDGDDVSNLQLSWEWLELSKMIYLKDEDKESQLKAAQAFLKLGEVSVETEQYEKATEDFMSCLEIQKKHLEVSDRLLAETHYQLGLSNGFDKKYDASIEHYQTAIKVIEQKVSLLEKKIEENSTGKGKEPSNPDDPVTQATQEIKELKEILPDIASKIEDAEEEKKNLEQLKSMTKEIISGTVASLSSSDNPPAQQIEVKKAADISHLIRKKRKPDEEIDDQESKKSRQEDGSGDATTQNGHDKPQQEEKEKSAEKSEPMTT